MDANLAHKPEAGGNHVAELSRTTANRLAVDETPDVLAAFDGVWDDKSAAGLARGALPAAYCDEVYERFVASPARASRADGVPGDVVGATQYAKTPDEYMALAHQSSAAVRQIMGGEGSLLQVLFRGLAKRLAQRGVLMRPLIFEGEPAPPARFARWTAPTADGRWLLRPHDDWEQTRGYREWEITGIDKLIAVNVYLRSNSGSGQLVVSGWRPSDEDRANRGLQGSGYPYPDDDLLHRPFVTLPVSTGDVAIIDGSHLHGVLIGDGHVEERLIANLFVGRLGNSAVYWA